MPADSVNILPGPLYHRMEPRIALSRRVNNLQFTISYDRTSQFFHLLANSSVGLPTDIWMPSGRNIKPQNCNIYAIGYETKINKWVPSISLFYKDFFNTTDFKDNANLFLNKYVESQLLQRAGKAYGMELSMQKKSGIFTGLMSYTLSKTFNRIEGVNEGKEYPSRYDKRHNLSATGKFDFSKKIQASFNFVYTTGGAITVPAGNFVFDGVVFNYYTSRNSYRLPDYHRLDMSLKYSPSANMKRKYKSAWSFDLYNAYGRKNPFTVFSMQSDYGLTNTGIKALYLFRVVPSVAYSFTF